MDTMFFLLIQIKTWKLKIVKNVNLNLEIIYYVKSTRKYNLPLPKQRKYLLLDLWFLFEKIHLNKIFLNCTAILNFSLPNRQIAVIEFT